MPRLYPSARDADLDAWAPIAMAVFFGLGSAVAIGVTVLPGRQLPLVSAATCVVGLLCAGLLLTGWRRAPMGRLHVLGVAGSVCVAGGVANAEYGFGPDGVLFVWVGLYAGFFMGRAGVALHTAVIGTLYALVLTVWPGAGIPIADTAQGWVLVVGSVAAAGCFGLVLRRIVEELLEQQLRLARTDTLTGLANRAELLRVGQERAGRPGPWAILLLDLDDFKVVNDAEGHEAGDRLLCSVAGRLRATVRAEDLVVRLGGDEFAVLAHAATPEEADRAADRLHRALAGPPSGAPIECSVGVAVATDGDRTAAELLRDADLAMYAAKHAGAGWRRHTPQMHSAVAERLELQRELERGLADQVQVHVQPILTPGDGRFVAAEALARWTHPRLGEVSPSRFIPVAERSGLIVELGYRMLRESCRLAAGWAPDGPGAGAAVSVNLSPRQLLDPELVATVAGALDVSGLAPERLMLEITETTVMTEPEESIVRLQELRALGVRLAVDDFGTGHSSLAYLQRLPVTDLKVAREFVATLESDPRGLALAQGIIGLGRALGLRVIAEGVETPGQLEALRATECDLVQGFLLARPMPASALESTLRAQSSAWRSPQARSAPSTPASSRPALVSSYSSRGGRSE